jgi:tetratricopeptide (TPR) repeat protein
MNDYLQQVSMSARSAVQSRDWTKVRACAKEILKRRNNSPEGYFLVGLAEKASNRPAQAVAAFSRALTLDGKRYDAAVELASQYLHSNQYNEAVALLQKYESHLSNSPRYLDMAGMVYTNVGLPERGWPLLEKANDLQPGVDSLQANLAACSVYVGKIDEAKKTYRRLLSKFPNHQRNHYELSRLEKAANTIHLEQMKNSLGSTNLSADKNIFMYYAIGKELEDLERWDEAFHYYELAGNAVATVSGYDVETDIQLIDKIIKVCNSDWLNEVAERISTGSSEKDPIFIVGLPRTGTTLTERIVSSHSRVESIGETYFMQIVLKRESGIQTAENMTTSIIEAASKKNIAGIAEAYLEAVAFKFGAKPMFIEKFPENILYLGFIAKAYPHARIIHLRRNPMDACFAMYKQSFFRYAYTLDDLGQYYVGYNRLLEHWRETLGDRLIEVEYESLVSDQEGQTRKLLEKIGLNFEEACLDFEQNMKASNTASTVQIREKIHTRSVNRWTHFAEHLQPLKSYLLDAGIQIGQTDS